MARTPSTMMLEIGAPAPDFALPDFAPGADARTVRLADFKGKDALLVMFICNHCPFVKHLREELARLGTNYQGRNVGVVAIMPNDVENYPDDAPEKMTEECAQAGYTFPYLYDETQEVAKAYKAACTPDFYVFDADFKLAYRGQLDASRPQSDIPVTGADVRAAIDAVLGGSPVPVEPRPSMGCNIKWKPGNEPDYFG